jgi:pimeloyl-ACP methyl ester carboxylesterase
MRFSSLFTVAALLLTGAHGMVAQGADTSAATVSSADGVPIAYETSGEGETTLVFVHGWSGDRSYWKAQQAEFSRDFKVVLIDLAGHGESGLDRKSWTIESFGNDVVAVIKKLDIDNVILIGHSMGGDVTAAAALKMPVRIKGLIWVDAYKHLRTPRTAEQRQTLLDPFRTNFVETTRTFVRGLFPPNADAALVERVALDMSSAPPAVALASMEASLTNDRKIPQVLQDLDLPVVAINPEDPPTDAASLKRYGIKVVLMPGVGHFLMMEDATRFNTLLRTAIAGIH